MNKEFKEICNKSEAYGKISEQYIDYAEKELGVSFPKEYRNFLLEFGAVLGDGFEIYGLVPELNQDEPPIWQNVVAVTHHIRSFNQVGTEDRHMIPISSDGMDTYYFINSKSSDTEIWAVNYEEKKLIASNLLEFVKFLMQQS